MADLEFERKELAEDRLWLKAAGGFNAENAEQLTAWLEETKLAIAHMHDVSGKLVSCVFDIVGVTEVQDPRVVSALISFQQANKPHIRRTALVVKDPHIRLASEVVGELADRYNIRAFASNQEAETWAFSEQE